MGVDDAEALGTRGFVACGAEELEAQADAEGGAVVGDAVGEDGVEGARAEGVDAGAERADAREDEVGRGARTIRVVGEIDLCAEAGEGGGNGGGVGDAGVEDGDGRAGACASSCERPLGAGHAGGGVDRDGLAQGEGEGLEARLGLVVVVVAADEVDMQRQAGGGREGLEEVGDVLGGDVAECFAHEGDVDRGEGPAREIDDRSRE
jgi:hypothetical protein